MKNRLEPDKQYIFSISRTQRSVTEGDYCFGKAVYHPDGRCGPRIQSDFQLVVIIRGSLRLTVGNKVHQVMPGEGILQHPGMHEFYRFAPDQESEHTWCQVNADRKSVV